MQDEGGLLVQSGASCESLSIVHCSARCACLFQNLGSAICISRNCKTDSQIGASSIRISFMGITHADHDYEYDNDNAIDLCISDGRPQRCGSTCPVPSNTGSSPTRCFRNPDPRAQYGPFSMSSSTAKELLSLRVTSLCSPLSPENQPFCQVAMRMA